MGNKLVRGVNDLASTHRGLLKEWHPNRNLPVDPDSIGVGSSMQVWWLCEKGHEWQALPYNRARGQGCPICSGKRVLSGFNDLATTHPELAAQWHPSKNGDLTPADVIAGTGKKVWWLCEKGHEWQASGAKRKSGTGCPICRGSSVASGINDLATTHPELAAQWHPSKNSELMPTDVTAGTEKRIWWLCDRGHEWQASGSTRTRPSGCPVCSNQLLLKGYNDLATTHPELAAQWHPSKNGDLTPADVIAGTGKKVWWLCDKGHEWQASGNVRTRPSGCPVCAGVSALKGFNDLATTHPELAAQWHPSKNGDLTPADVIAGTGKKIWWLCDKGHEWQASGSQRTTGRGCPVCANLLLLPGFNDFGSTHPELAAQWNPLKNSGLSPADVIGGSGTRFWWLCDKGHEWQAPISGRKSSSGCPVCSNQLLLKGYNDLATTHPELAAQWHPSKNGDLTPADVIAGTGKKIWWLCDKGHEWQAVCVNRLQGKGCPVCSNQLLLKGYNDLATTHPELAAQWHPSKNGSLTPADVITGTPKPIWWICDKGHEWQVSPNSRVTGETGCAVCSGRRLLSGYNDLQSLNPGLASEWHPTLNGSKTPRDVLAGTSIKIWWLCEKGHSWQTTIASRKVSGCPDCAEYGYNPGKAATLYFIANKALHARKIGITNVGTRRLETFAKAGWTQLLITQHPDGRLVQAVEKALLTWLRIDHALPQHLGPQDMPRTGGWSETFSEEGPSNFEVMAQIQAQFKRLDSDG